MSEQDTYNIDGAVSWKAEQIVVELMRDADGIKRVFGVNSKPIVIRRAGDAEVARTMPSIAVECHVTQALPGTNEYAFRFRVIIKTQADEDEDGQQAGALLGAIRDMLHTDTVGDADGYPGDCRGFCQSVNAIGRGIVFHQITETGEDPPVDDNRTRTRIIMFDGQGYPGTTT